MVLVENVLNREHISYTKIKKVTYSSHDEGKHMDRHIIEEITVPLGLDKFHWKHITKCKDFKGFSAKDGSIVINVEDKNKKVR